MDNGMNENATNKYKLKYKVKFIFLLMLLLGIIKEVILSICFLSILLLKNIYSLYLFYLFLFVDFYTSYQTDSIGFFLSSFVVIFMVDVLLKPTGSAFKNIELVTRFKNTATFNICAILFYILLVISISPVLHLLEVKFRRILKSEATVIINESSSINLDEHIFDKNKLEDLDGEKNSEPLLIDEYKQLEKSISTINEYSKRTDLILFVSGKLNYISWFDKTKSPSAVSLATKRNTAINEIEKDKETLNEIMEKLSEVKLYFNKKVKNTRPYTYYRSPQIWTPLFIQ